MMTTTTATTSFADLAAEFAALPAAQFNFRRQAQAPVERKHQRAHGHFFYTAYLGKESGADRWNRQLLQGTPTDDARPCRQCGVPATTPLCVYCAIDQLTAE